MTRRAVAWMFSCACVTPLVPVKPAPVERAIGLELRDGAWVIDNPSVSPLYATNCGALRADFEWQTHVGWERAPTIVSPACSSCASDVESVSAGASVDVQPCNASLVAGTYRARVSLVDIHGKLFDSTHAFEVLGISEAESEAFVLALMKPDALACLPFGAGAAVEVFAWVGTRAAVRRLRDVHTGSLSTDAAILAMLAYVPDGIDDLASMATGDEALAAQIAFSEIRSCAYHSDDVRCDKVIESWLARPVREEFLIALWRARGTEHRFDAALREHLIAAIPVAPTSVLPLVLVMLTDMASRADLARTLPAMMRRRATVNGAARHALDEAIETARLPPDIGRVGHWPDRDTLLAPAGCDEVKSRLMRPLSRLVTQLTSRGHLDIKPIGNTITTPTNTLIASPERVLTCQHPFHFCE